MTGLKSFLFFGFYSGFLWFSLKKEFAKSVYFDLYYVDFFLDYYGKVVYIS